MDNRLSTQHYANNRYIFIILLLVVLARFGIDLGFSLKPYMIFLILFLFIHLSTFYFVRLQLFEIAMLMFFLVYGSSGTFSLYPDSSLRIILGIILYLFCYMIIKFVLDNSPHKIVENAISNVGIIFNVVSLVMYVIGINAVSAFVDGERSIEYGVMVDRGYPRLIGLLQDPNFFIFYNTIFFTYFLCNHRSLKGKVGLILCMTTCLLTFSRGGLLVLFLILLLYLILNNPLKQIKILSGLFSLGAIGIYVSVAHLNIDLIGILGDRFEDFTSDGGSGRIELWGRAWEFFSSNILLGIGAFNYADYNDLLYGDGMSVHNTFLDILSESGLLGFSFYILFICIVLIQLIQGDVHRKKTYLFLAFIGFILQMGSLTVIINDMFFMYIAILSAYIHQESTNRKEIEESQKVPPASGPAQSMKYNRGGAT